MVYTLNAYSMISLNLLFVYLFLSVYLFYLLFTTWFSPNYSETKILTVSLFDSFDVTLGVQNSENKTSTILFVLNSTSTQIFCITIFFSNTAKVVRQSLN